MTEFGYHTISGYGTDSNAYNTANWLQVTPLTSGTLTTIYVYTTAAGSGQQLGVAVYSDSAGAIGNKLGGIEPASGPVITPQDPSYDWVGVDVSSFAISLTANTPVWIAFMHTSTGLYSNFYDKGSAAANYRGLLASVSSWPADGSGVSNYYPHTIALYGEYTEAGTNLSGIMF